MELKKVVDVAKYKGTLYFIDPVIDCGKVTRNIVYKCEKDKQKLESGYFNCLFLTNDRKIRWYQSRYYVFISDKLLDENTEINTKIRIFTEREEAKNALKNFSKEHAYELSDSVDKRIKYLEAEKKKINEELNKLKETKKECFEHLSTTFSFKS